MSGPDSLQVAKGHGLGNDYLVVDQAVLPFPLTPARIAALCDRHTGLGSDGLLVADVSPVIHEGERLFGLRIYNPDGTEAEKSGNGLRIFAAWLHGRALVRDDWFAVRLVKDTVRMRVEGAAANGVVDVRVEIGRASFRGRDVAFIPRDDEVLGFPLDLDDVGTAEITTVSLSNPHCVVFVDALDRSDFLLRAPVLCTHPAFAEGTNVQFARVTGPRTLEAWIWERGAGETLASGSSSCAVAAAAVRRGLVEPGTFEVRMQGGSTEVAVAPSFDIVLRGPARMVFFARLEPGWVKELG